jgi:hypothetical protein
MMTKSCSEAAAYCSDSPHVSCVSAAFTEYLQQTHETQEAGSVLDQIRIRLFRSLRASRVSVGATILNGVQEG